MNAGTLWMAAAAAVKHTQRATRAHAPPKFKFKFKFKSSPSTLTPTASLESTFDRLPVGCLLFTKQLELELHDVRAFTLCSSEESRL